MIIYFNYNFDAGFPEHRLVRKSINHSAFPSCTTTVWGYMGPWVKKTALLSQVGGAIQSLIVQCACN